MSNYNRIYNTKKTPIYATNGYGIDKVPDVKHKATLHSKDLICLDFVGTPTKKLNDRIISLYGYHIKDGVRYVNTTQTNLHVLESLKFKVDPRIGELLNVSHKDKFTSIEGMLGKPYKYQCDGISFLDSRKGRALLASDMGVGKTLQAIGYIHKNKSFPAYIICPSSLKLNWRNEIIKWLGNDQKISVINGRAIIRGNLSSQWNIINYDVVKAWLSELKLHAKKMGYGCMVLDECHKIKNESTARTKACLSLGKSMNSIVCISGTPIDNRPSEFYPIFNLLAPGLFSSKYEFGYKFCNGHQSQFGFDMTGASNTKELNDLLAKTIMIRDKKKDVLSELPSKRNIIIPLEMTRSQEQDYARVNEEFKQLMKSTDASKKQGVALTRIGALKKYAASFKLDAVCEWIDDFLETGQKLVIFMVHRDIQAVLVDRYKDKSVSINGLTKLEDRQLAVDRFQKDQNVRLFIATLKTGGEGITLTQASTVAFVEFGWTVSEHDQCTDRVHRIGQVATCVDSYYFVMQNTIEDSIMKILDRKRQLLDNVLDGVDSESGNLFKELMKEFD